MPLSDEQKKKIIENVSRFSSSSKSRTRGGMFRQLGRHFGPFGELLGMMSDLISGGRRPSHKDIQDAIELLSEQGFDVLPGRSQPPPAPPGPVHAPPVQRPRRSQPPPVTTGRPRPVVQPGPVQPTAEPWPEEGMIQTMPTRIRGMYDLVPKGVEGLSPEIWTPESSNVYSIQYDYENEMLYVRFNAPSPVIGYKEMTSICSGKRYKCGIRPHNAGPLYSYGGARTRISELQFNEFVSAASKGQWVWEHLRVCGSTWQHQVPYTLTSVPKGGHVPRKSTRRGLRVRTVPVVGQGRRGHRISSLPEELYQ